MSKDSAPVNDFSEYAKIRSAVAWRPEPGDQISGTVIKVVGRKSEFGVYPIAIADTGEKNYTAIHMFHTLLRQQAKDAKLSGGDEFSLAYMGRIESRSRKDANGQPVKYHNYILMVNGVETDLEYVWDSEDEDTPAF